MPFRSNQLTRKEIALSKEIISEFNRALIEIAWHFGAKGLNGECCDNLTMPEFIALDKVSTTQNCPVQDVGYCLGFTKSGATRVVNRLEKKGYIIKVKSPRDARVCCVVITESGEKVLKSANSRYLNLFNELMSKLPPQMSSAAVRVITAMAKTLKS